MKEDLKEAIQRMLKGSPGPAAGRGSSGDDPGVLCLLEGLASYLEADSSEDTTAGTQQNKKERAEYMTGMLNELTSSKVSVHSPGARGEEARFFRVPQP
jgi:hypothetical protein